MEQRPVSEFVRFIEVLNDHYCTSDQSPINTTFIKFDDELVVTFHQSNDPRSVSNNLTTTQVRINYYACVEVVYDDDNKPLVWIRHNDLGLYHADGQYGYYKDLEKLNNTPMYEFNRKFTDDIKLLNDWDDSTIFQYGIIEEKATYIYEMYKVLQKIVNDEKYKPLLTAALRKY